MFKNARTMRIVLNSILLLAIVALGVTVYKAGTREKQEKQEQAQLEEEVKTEEFSAEEEEEPMVDAGTSEVQAELETEDAASTEEETEEMTQETAQNEAASEMVEMEAEDTAAEVGIEMNFTEESLMEWPLNGEVVLDYDMENTIYFPTLDQYKLNPSISVKSDVGAPVAAAANGTVTSIAEDAKTGLTMTLDMGNGYEAIYGQLTEPVVSEGQTVAQGTILGYVGEPTKYYSVEGSNLYFAMKKDGEPVDPIAYLP